MKKKVFTTILIIVSAACHAQVVQVNVEGVCSERSSWDVGNPADQFEIGDTIICSYKYDTDLMAEDYFFEKVEDEYIDDVFSIDWFWQYETVLADYSINVFRQQSCIQEYNFNNMPYTLVDSENASSYGPHLMGMASTTKSFGIYCATNELPIPDIQDSVSFGYGFNSDNYIDPVEPEKIPNSNTYNSTWLRISRDYYSSQGASDGDERYFFNINSIEITSVPEPATLLLISVGTWGVLKRRKRY